MRCLRVPKPSWCAWQAQGPVREVKDAEKEVMDKYLARFKQHTTADEVLEEATAQERMRAATA
jgi:hypothetical protein